MAATAASWRRPEVRRGSKWKGGRREERALSGREVASAWPSRRREKRKSRRAAIGVGLVYGREAPRRKGRREG